MWNIQANIYLDEEAKQKDPVIGDLLEKIMNKYVHVCMYVCIFIQILSYYVAVCIYNLCEYVYCVHQDER